jgi:hypothetical protein
MVRIITLVFLLLINTANAQQTSPGQPEEGTGGTAKEPAQNTSVDKMHRATTSLFQDLVGKSDGIFMDDDYRSFGENHSRLRVRFDLGYIEHHGWDEKLKVKMRLILPGMNDRIQLIAGGDEGDDDDITAEEDGNNLALRWVGLQSEKASVSFDLGLRYKSSNLDPFVRLNSGILYDISENWYGYTFNRLYYYSDTHWRNDFRQSFNRPITEDLLFRARTRVQYFDENDYNPYLEQKFSLFQTLKNKSAVAYEALWQKQAEEDSVFDEDEIKGKLEDSYQTVALRLRYRRNVWRDWLYVEVWPIIAWPEERDWDTVLGANFRLEVTFGGKGKSRLSD